MKNDLIEGTKTKVKSQEKSKNYEWVNCITNSLVRILKAIRGGGVIQYKKEKNKDGTTKTEFTFKQ
jgi:hypothetical protein